MDDALIKRVLPHSLEAEQSVIGSMLMDREAIITASEIVTGALQDLDRAVIIGQRSYGKGLVQSPRPLGYNAMLKLTTAKYYIPSGR